MIWLSWRQFRLQAMVTAVALVVTAIYLLLLGSRIRGDHDEHLAQCRGTGDCTEAMSRFQFDHLTLLLLLNGALILVPAILGMFVGAPLVARELETGTHRLVWNQSVTRRRWLASKLTFACLGSMAVAGLASLLLTWAAAPVDQVAGDRFTAVVFGARHVVPVAYAAFACALGAVIGMVVRRTVPAMALTTVVFVVTQVFVVNEVRPNLSPPHHVTLAMPAEAIEQVRGLGGITNRPTVRGLQMPDAWVVSTSELLTVDGRPLAMERFDGCLRAGPWESSAECLGALDLHVEVSYQPNERYWRFQWLEFAIYLGLTAGLAGLGLWRIQRRSVGRRG